jgi:starch phosphorylase
LPAAPLGADRADLFRAGREGVQLNDTHPSIGVAELMRLLVDERLLGCERAWEITQRTFGYTNHTLLPEALETWPSSPFGSPLPGHLGSVQRVSSLS